MQVYLQNMENNYIASYQEGSSSKDNVDKLCIILVGSFPQPIIYFQGPSKKA